MRIYHLFKIQISSTSQQMNLSILFTLLYISSACIVGPTPGKNILPGVGIDFGTKFTSVGIRLNGTFVALKNEYGNTRTPSIVSFDTNGEYTIGESAQIQSKINPKGNTIYHPKRFIGLE
jgi:hypothetical protein